MKTNTQTDCPALSLLCAHLGADIENAIEARFSHYGMPVYEIDGEEWAVGTDEEADAAWDMSLDSYIEECIAPELEKIEAIGPLSPYVRFDEEMWKRDAKMDGRGHSLSSYDGDEVELSGGFFAYRIN